MTEEMKRFLKVFKPFKLDELSEIDINKFRPFVNLWLKAKYLGKVT